MQNTLFKLFIPLMLIILPACGTFRIEGQAFPEAYPAGTTNVSGDSLSSGYSLDLSGFMVILGLLVFVILVAGVVTGIYMLVRTRPASAAYPSIGDTELEKRGLKHLLRFNPKAISVTLSLLIWAGIIGIGTIITLGALLLGSNAVPGQPWEPALTQPSSILVGAGDMEEGFIRYFPDLEACSLTPPSDETQVMQCALSVEESPLVVTVELRNRAIWYCNARYDNQMTTCRASFDNLDHQTYVVIDSDLGISHSRFQQLVEETSHAYWSEQDWMLLARSIVFLLSLALLVLLWRASNHESASKRGLFLRIMYSGGISLMFFGAINYVAFGLLLVLRLID